MDDERPGLDARVRAALRDRRMLFLSGPLEPAAADGLCAELLLLDATSDDPVTLWIDSPGGVMTGMFAIHDVMAGMRSPVHTRCIGLAASAGGFLLATGTGERSATPNARVMLHQPSGGIGGTAADIAIQAQEQRAQRTRMEAILATTTGRSPADIRRDLDRDHWLSAEEAVAYGVVDRVATGRERTAARA